MGRWRSRNRRKRPRRIITDRHNVRSIHTKIQDPIRTNVTAIHRRRRKHQPRRIKQQRVPPPIAHELNTRDRLILPIPERSHDPPG